MMVSFTKMQGLGNDFVVIDAVRQPIELTVEQIRRLADRRRGVGCDQVLMVAAPTSGNADFTYRIFNADGSEAEQCGNGARCIARFLHEKGLAAGDTMRVEALSGLMTLILADDGQVHVDMGVPCFEPEAVPFLAPARAKRYELAVAGQTVSIGVASLGNPHAVMEVADIDQAPVSTLGPAIESHERFPRRANVGFMERVSRDEIRLRVYERGVGETQACGSGACGAVVVGQDQGLLDSCVTVHLPGGRLVVSWAGEGQPVWMTGPAETVFEGRIEL